VDADTTVMVFTSHGFGRHYGANPLLDEILRRLEGTPSLHWPNVMRPVRSLYRSLLPVDLRTRLRPLAAKVFDGVEQIDDLSVARDRQARKCFMLPSNDNCGNIRVNLVGREPKGRIRAGADFDAFFSALAEDLLEIVNLDTGQPVVKEVLKTADHYSGGHVDDLPDIIVRYNRDAEIRRIGSAKIGIIEGDSPSSRTGDHRPEGLFFVSGPGLSPGHLNEAVGAIDLAPTMASLLGLELPDADGNPMTALLRETDRTQDANP
jgi:predicted AlkP superfamily phosphohydrolase/phosphomutase